MKQRLLKLRIWFSDLNLRERVSAALCAAPIVVTLASVPPSPTYDDAEYSAIETVFQWLIGIPSLFIFAVLVAPTQIGIFYLVRRSSIPWVQWTLCAASALLLIPVQRFFGTTDLSANSTAALGAVFYPLQIALFSLPVGWLLVWFARRITPHP
jgi:hypothetical protein